MVAALELGHQLPRALLQDTLLEQGAHSLLNRSAWIPGMGAGLKAVTVYPDNPANSRPTVQGLFVLFDETSGAVRATIDGALITRWKTAADSVLGAKLLAPPKARRLLVIGAGVIARALVEAYAAVFPLLRIGVWARAARQARSLVTDLSAAGVTCVYEPNLAVAAAEADIVSTATSATTPVLRGEWLSAGTHVDLVGAYRPDMREADDLVLRKSKLFVDCRETTLTDIGEIALPLQHGLIDVADIQGDLYDLVTQAPARLADAEITLFKNGGGAHLDLMVAHAIFQMYSQS